MLFRSEIYGYNVIDPLSVMLTHLAETVKKHAYELLNRAETIRLVENLKQSAPELVEEIVPNILPYAKLEKLLRNLLQEGVPIKDLSTIVETAADAFAQGRDLDMTTEQVRGALARTITRRFCEDGQLRVITLDAEVEKKIISSLTRNEQGVYLAMGPELMQSIIAQLAEHLKKFGDLSQTPVILVSQVIRGYFSMMITQFYPNVYVLSFNEITNSVQIQALGVKLGDISGRVRLGCIAPVLQFGNSGTMVFACQKFVKLLAVHFIVILIVKHYAKYPAALFLPVMGRCSTVPVNASGASSWAFLPTFI